MNGCSDLQPTHRVVALRDEVVPDCKRVLASELTERATDLRVVVHPTEQGDVPETVAALDPIASDRAAFADDETERHGSLPEARDAVEAVLESVGDDGDLPVTALCFRADRFDAVVTASTSHSHVGRLDTEDSTLLDDLSVALSGVGVVVPEGPSVGWEQDDRYLELDAHQLCVYAERPADFEDRRSTTHSCHDLTRLAAMDADADTGRVELTWRDADSLVGWAMQSVFGSPPTELTVPSTDFDAVRTYLGRFLRDSASSSSHSA